MIRRIHYFSGAIIFIFVMMHVLNHLMILKSETAHIYFMDAARKFYRHPIGEAILFVTIAMQVYSGIALVKGKWRLMSNVYDRLQVYSGIFLAYFLTSHTLAVLVGRHILNLDTNLYFGASVVNNNPALFYYVLHYGLGVIAFFTHLGCIHRHKAARSFNIRQLNYQCWFLFGMGVILAVLIVGHMTSITIPKSYQYLPFGKY